MDPATSENPRPPAPDGQAASSPAGDPDEAEEVDVWLGAYAARAMAPSFIVCGVITAGIALAAWRLREKYGIDPQPVRLCTYVITGMLWSVQLLRVWYRTTFTTYRLTTRRVLRDRGLRRPADGELELWRVASVHVERAGPFAYRLDVGKVRVVPEPGAGGPLVLEGVRQPEKVSEVIWVTAERARQKALRACAAPGGQSLQTAGPAGQAGPT